MGMLSRLPEDEMTRKINKRLKMENKIIGQLVRYEDRDPEVLYCALRKYIAARYPYPDDMGYIGIADENYPPLYYAGDILIHVGRFEPEVGDIMHFRQYGPDGMYLVHGKVTSVDKVGYVNVIGPTGGEGLVHLEMMLGVLVEVIPFMEGMWDRLFTGLMRGDYKSLRMMLEHTIERYRRSEDIPEERKNQIIPELKKRVKALEERV
ncbi:MAG TPA: hypothetical protein ENG09_01940 [Candidatus Syntrophoarchaeum butanivorans]|uniref:Uncharacterized protein n=1 Tax=Candidatus Syntropharchaeum butanivorans TaxID=1839936 RepID=A0A1F2P3Q3_9EURY|nr:MAG: hypothetical protein SBU_001223 [Candidatus Syntrophoarchaeum butanivorans]RJS73430.1 MAG: hypothetical protein CW694_00570 [Candidatus Syntrophoarchaeum sp. WYZ-LMO15]HDM36005.1 hypothetical protein [Candidatus Syntrophoarchaeum butanivorans]HEC56555.1 hypothetical protein [Candidatus Syntrophoarchaeum butanivorans]